ncbi:ABC transporter ATP-binding protein [Sulfoacidibacillus thermotolerans]|uniref:ABC transporter domain-containing protein n=1 Tax=Sulfoacidibacillus thermotolerans TaxID=1765684 RepID=A0A2U3D8E9_SULT2|nr:ABC transporter ATP-binding protein [Sulfoacidibacillus thermotolerans]PWI57558.1 hypothetical protein BM613_08025 [Sulfoacidibacillus thermotolerans]
MKALLEVENLHTKIGQFSILQGVSLSVCEHTIHVLLGRNGAGKTTTLRTMMGYLRPVPGIIRFEDQELTGIATFRIARYGIGYMPEDHNLFANLTVEENLLLSLPKQDTHVRSQIAKMLDLFPDLRVAWRRPAGTLSGGQRQMLALASVLVSKPRLLLVDEPSKGLSPRFVERIGDALEQLRSETTIVLVEQNFYLAKRIGDYVTVLDEGHTVYSGEMQSFAASDELQKRYLGLQTDKKGGAK